MDGVLLDLYRDGFARVNGFADRTEVRALRQIVFPAVRRAIARESNVWVEVVPRGDGDRGGIRQLQRLSYFVPQLRSHPVFQRLWDLAKLVLGARAVYTWDTAIIKCANGRDGTPWHQDAAFDPRAGMQTYLPFAISFWLALTPVMKQSGCLSYVPRSHYGDLLPHLRLGEHSLSIQVDEQRFRPVDTFAPPGTLLVHQPKTWHRSRPNATSLARVAWSVNFDA